VPHLSTHVYLVGGLEHVLFSSIVGMMIQSDYYVSGGVKQPTRYCSRIMRAQGLSAPSRSKAVAGRFTTCRLRDCWEPPHFFWACDVWENDHQHPSTIKVRSTRLPDTAIKYTPEGKQPVCCFKELCSFPWATMI